MTSTPAGRSLRITVTADVTDSALAGLAELGSVQVGGWGATGELAAPGEFERLLRNADIVVLGYEPLTEAILARTSLRCVVSIRGGPDANIDLAACARRGIPVTGTVGREAIPVADFTFGLLLDLVRHITQAATLLRRGQIVSRPGAEGDDLGWGMGPEDPWNSLKGIELAGKTIGLVGYGAVGRQVAVRARAFGMRVLAYDPLVGDGDGNAVLVADLDDLLADADVISLHARMGPTSAGLLGRRHFSLMKASAIVLNTARAGLIDRQALLDALAEHRIAGAALDVHHREPLPADDPFFSLDNVLLTPHIAGATVEVEARHSAMVLDNVRRFIDGQPLVNVVNGVTAIREPGSRR
jgi:D-3-phosphoglycerate dehydrogenase / 2-oxoglutarate reductase